MLSKYSKLSSIAYLEPKEARGLYQALGFRIEKYFNVDGAQAYLLRSVTQSVLVFRGTEMKGNDLLADLKMRRVEEGTGSVHRGFKAELDKLWGDISSHLHASPPHLVLFITGHSLGAAMATIAAGRLQKDMIVQIITFGSPRVGNQDFADSIKCDHVRVVNGIDFITKNPLWVLGYRHTGTLHYLSFDAKLLFKMGWRVLTDIYRSLRRAFEKGQKFSGIFNHPIGKYTQKLLDIGL
jgi:triacylglycerol lipase